MPSPPASPLRQAVQGSAQAFRAQLGNPAEVQTRVLRNILAANASSAFGQQYGFADIPDWQTYAQRVPIQSYEDCAPWINRAAQGEAHVLTVQSIIAFEQTGGSTSGRKLIPYTEAGLAAFRQGLLPWLDDLFTHHADLAGGTFYWSISPACRAPEKTAGGIPIGMPSDAAYFGAQVGQAIAATLAVAPDVGGIADFQTWRERTLAQLFADENLAMISVWSPSFLTELLRHAVDNRAWLVASMAATNPERARRIERALSQPTPDYRTIWPRLRIISCWDQASAAPLAHTLRQQFVGVQVQGKGLLATEALMTLPLSGCDYPVLALESGFFEFQQADGTTLLADQVRTGEDYRIILTTHSGLYRYAIGDVVRVRGFAGRTPMLEFVGRSDAACDLCGEKLTDAFVAGCLASIRHSIGHDPSRRLGLGFAMLAPNCAGLVPDQAPGYVVLLDEKEVAQPVAQEMAQQIARQLDAALHANPQYAYARQLGQLAPLAPVLCREPLAGWLAYCTGHKGQRLGDVKLPALLKDAGWTLWAAPSAAFYNPPPVHTRGA